MEIITTAEKILLGEFLQSQESNTGLGFTQLHGLITSMITSVGSLDPSEYEDMYHDYGFQFDSLDQKTVSALLLKLHNEITQSLEENDTFNPLFYRNGALIPYRTNEDELIKEWCLGYIDGATTDDEESNENAIEYLLPFAVLSDTFNLKGELDSDDNIITDDTEFRTEFKNDLPKMIQENYAHWKHVREYVPAPYVRETKKVGRNELCPCGSNKKFKKCCAN